MKHRKTITTLVIILFYLFIQYKYFIISFVAGIKFTSLNEHGIILIGYIISLALIFIPFLLLYDVKFKTFTDEFGMRANFFISFVFILIASIPIIIGLLFNLKDSLNLLSYNTIVTVFFAAIMNEFVSRAFLFGQLFRRGGWGFVQAAAIGPVFLGMKIISNTLDPLIISISFINVLLMGLFYAWLFIEWNNNIWIPMGLHIFINLSWLVFENGEKSCFGSTEGIIYRSITIFISIVITILMCVHRKKFRINKLNIFAWK
ncbi:MAG: CPBP family intramembrane metalloprotease [Bacteroidales bacterium]|nr:CPBP family intramembrane metalloprotease [Bacteroidales bacterium]